MCHPSCTINKVKGNDYCPKRGVLEEWHIAILRNEQEYVRKRYHAVARTLASDIIWITRKEAADMIDRSKRQIQRIVKRYLEKKVYMV